jgi:hypothetical protein
VRWLCPDTQSRHVRLFRLAHTICTRSAEAAKLLPGGKHATSGSANATDSASSKGGGGGGTNKGLAITLPLLFVLLLVAGAIGGWFWWSRRRVAAAQVPSSTLRKAQSHIHGLQRNSEAQQILEALIWTASALCPAVKLSRTS